MAIKKDVILKTVELIREDNAELQKLLRKIRKYQKDPEKVGKVTYELVEEALIQISILLSANIQARYDLETYMEENKSWGDLNKVKALSVNCKLDIDALKSQSFTLTEIIKTMRFKEEQKAYKEQVM